MTWHPDMARIVEAVQSAPSTFNQRPWDIRLAGEARDRVDLYADPDPDLGVLLPREVAISCGAALYNLRLAIRVAGRVPSVWLLPGLDQESPLIDHLGAGPVLVASVEVMPGRSAPPPAGIQELYEAMWLRHTYRGPYPVLPVPLALLVEMEDAAASERGWLRTLHPRQVKLMLRDAARAGAWLSGEVPDDDGQADPARAIEEHGSDRLRAGLGRLNQVPADRYGPRPADTELPPTRRDFWAPGKTARFERRPQLMSLSTDDDRPLDWLRAGQALQRALLTGTRYSMSLGSGRSDRYRVSFKHELSDWRPRPRLPAGYGVTASFLTQSLELADLRGRPRRWPWRWYYDEVPQMVLRVGFAPVERVPAPPLYSSGPG